MGNEFVAEWYKFADTDLASAEFLCGMHPQPYEIICYHCQQAAEKYLKGFLIYSGVIEPPKIHALDDLCELCADFDARFHEIKDACNVLTVYGVQPRYPKEMEILESDNQKALSNARQIRDFEPLMEVRQIATQSDDDVENEIEILC